MTESFLTHYNVPTKGVTSLSFHPNGKRLLVSSRIGGVLLYSIDRQNRPFAFQAKGFSPIASLFSPDGTTVYASSLEGRIAAWKVHSPGPAVCKTAHPSRINAMDMWKESGAIITGSNDKSVKLWSPELEFTTSFPGHDRQVTACACCPTADLILSGDDGGGIALWDIRQPGKIPAWRYARSAEPMHKDVDHDSDDTKARSLLESKRGASIADNRKSVASVAFDRTGVMFCVSTDDKRLCVWDLRAPEQELSERKLIKRDADMFQQHEAPAGKALFHPRKPSILITGGDQTPRIFDLEVSALLYSFEGHEQSTCCCAWSPSGKTFATADLDGVVIVWKMPRNKLKPIVLSRPGSISVEPYHPPIESLSPEVLLEQLKLMNMHAEKLGDHLSAQERRVAALVEQYPAVYGATYEC